MPMLAQQPGQGMMNFVGHFPRVGIGHTWNFNTK